MIWKSVKRQFSIIAVLLNRKHYKALPSGTQISKISDENEVMNKFLFGQSGGFTLAEILIALTIIGIVAVLTYPTLQTYFHETAMKIKKRALYTRTSQAIALVSEMKKYESAYDFVNNGYREIYKIERVCGNENINIFGCNLPQEVKKADGTVVPMPTKWSELNSALTNLYWEDPENGNIYEYSQEDSPSASFFTDNGESINLFFNPKCKNIDEHNNSGFYPGKFACINMIYDINGAELPPNTIGKDIGFITVFGAQDSLVVSPFFDDENVGPINFSGAKGLCKAKGFNYRLPTEYELASMFINSELFGLADDGAVGFWSVNSFSADDVYYMHARTGYIEQSDIENAYSIRCLQR